MTKAIPLRLGCHGNAERAIKSHAFFSEIDWPKLEQRQVTPPFRPTIVSETRLIACTLVWYIRWYFSRKTGSHASML
jgi:hypothetical protein